MLRGGKEDAERQSIIWENHTNLRIGPSNAILRAVVLGTGPQITLQDLPPSLVGAPPLLASPIPPTRSYHAATVAFQRAVLRQALAQAQGNHTAAAQALGLQRTSFHRVRNSLGLR